jgi:hypothetical protein
MFGATLQAKHGHSPHGHNPHGHSPHGHSPFADSRRRRTHYERRRRCNTGRYKDEGADDCKDCTPGHFQEVVGTHDQTTCSACAAGKFQPSTKASACSICEAGRHQLATRSSSCALCAAGHFQPTASVSECKACPAGRFEPKAGSTNCAICEAGRYQLATGSTTCVVCAAGHFKPTASTSVCTLCATGRYQPATESTSCVECAAGQFQDYKGQSACSACTEHTYQEEQGQIYCNECDYTCPDGQVHSACGGGASGQCDACPDQHFRPSASPSRVCFGPYTTCTATQFVTKKATAAADRECTDHTTCLQTQWETKNAGEEHDRECTDHTNCGLTQWETKWAGSHHDRECIGYDGKDLGGTSPIKAIACPYTRCHHDPTHTQATSIIVTHVPHDHDDHAFLNPLLNPFTRGGRGPAYKGKEPPMLHHCMYFIKTDECKCFCHPDKTVLHLSTDAHVQAAARDRKLRRPCPVDASGKECSGVGGCLREGTHDARCICHYGFSGPLCEHRDISHRESASP